MTDEGGVQFVFLRRPTQCALWEDPGRVVGGRATFEELERYIDDSHLIRSLYKCRECGQLYFYEGYEWVDWDKGNDKYYSTFIPVQTPDEIADLKQTTVQMLLRFYPRLQWDMEKPVWIGKD